MDELQTYPEGLFPMSLEDFAVDGTILFDPSECEDVAEVASILDEYKFEASHAFVSGYNRVVLDTTTGERVVGASAIRAFLADRS